MIRTVAALTLITAFALAGCSGSSGSASGGTAQSMADNTTKAAYNDDVAGVTANMDDTLKRSVTRTQVGTISDQLHKLGDYQGLTLVSSDPAKNEFTYHAAFSNGSSNVVVRIDSGGKLSAYHVFVTK
ncbi:MAG TPA: hypothetical protein VIG32_05725 [Candidatus Baltobacteraceae bacterium]|jgi:hypothetical protein